MIRPDTADFIRRVVDPELHILREQRDSLLRQYAERIWDQERAEQEAHAAMLELSRMARWLLHAERVGREIGSRDARRLRLAGQYTALTKGGTR